MEMKTRPVDMFLLFLIERENPATAPHKKNSALEPRFGIFTRTSYLILFHYITNFTLPLASTRRNFQDQNLGADDSIVL